MLQFFFEDIKDNNIKINMLTVNQFVNVVLVIDKAHTALQRSINCKPG